MERMQAGDLDAVMEIWLRANEAAHDFLPANHWRESYGLVRELIPQAEVFVHRQEGRVRGFLGVAEGHYIAGLFVDPAHQSQGIGGRLIAGAKERFDALELHVYLKNEGAVRFYKRSGFVAVEERPNPEDGERELLMAWRKHP